MDNVSALASTTREEMGLLTAKASELGRTTVFSAKDAASGMAELAKAGFKTQEIMEAMPATMQLAAIGEMEVGERAKVAARIMAGMQIPASELHDVIDSIAVAATNSVTTVEELGDAMRYVGPAAHQAGMGIAEVMASLSVLANAGIAGEMGGTTLRNLVIRMSKPTEEAQAALDDLGVTFQGLHGDMLPMVAIIKQFEDSLAGLGDMEKLRILNTIFRNRGAVGAAALIGPAPAACRRNLTSRPSGRALPTRSPRKRTPICGAT